MTSIFVTHDQEEALEVADRVVVINQGKIEQEGTPQEVWDNPATPFVYGFLGDVNLFKGRASDGRVYLDDGMQLDSSDARGANDSQAFAYVRPHDLEVERYSPGQNLDAQGRPTGIVAQLSRAIVVGPIARLELIPSENTPSSGDAGQEALIEAQIPAQQFKEMGLREGETLVVTPRRAKVFWMRLRGYRLPCAAASLSPEGAAPPLQGCLCSAPLTWAATCSQPMVVHESGLFDERDS